MKKHYLILTLVLVAACNSGGSKTKVSGASSATDASSASSSNTGSSINPCPKDSSTTRCINASDYDKPVFYSLDGLNTSSTQTLAIADRSKSKEWDIAFRRNTILLNDGANGPGSIKVAVIQKQEHYYDQAPAADSSNKKASNLGAPKKKVFTQIGANLHQAPFTKPVPKDVSLKASLNGPAIPHNGPDSWYTYTPRGHKVTIHDTNYFFIKGSTPGEYGRVRATAYKSQKGERGGWLSYYTFAFSRYTKNATGASSWSDEVEKELLISKTPQCYDFSSTKDQGIVSCDTDSWDLIFVSEWMYKRVYLNSDVYGKGRGEVIGPVSAEDKDKDPTTYNTFEWKKDSSANDLTNFPYFEYNLEGKHKMWPNYRVYLIQKGTEHYKLQIVSYYSPITGKSGYPTINIAPVAIQK